MALEQIDPILHDYRKWSKHKEIENAIKKCGFVLGHDGNYYLFKKDYSFRFILNKYELELDIKNGYSEWNIVFSKLAKSFNIKDIKEYKKLIIDNI